MKRLPLVGLSFYISVIHTIELDRRRNKNDLWNTNNKERKDSNENAQTQ